MNHENKQMDVVDIFRKGDLDMSDVFQTKLRGSGTSKGNGLRCVRSCSLD